MLRATVTVTLIVDNTVTIGDVENWLETTAKAVYCAPPKGYQNWGVTRKVELGYKDDDCIFVPTT